MDHPTRPIVVAVAGRRIDPPDTSTPRFPLASRDRVRDDIRSALEAHKVSALVSSAACGADLLALDTARTLGIRCRIVLPFSQDRFRAESVVDRPGEWGGLYDAIVREAAARGDLVVLNEENEDAFARTNLAILAEGERLAAGAVAQRRALVVWDGESRGAGDVTRQFKAAAASRGWDIEEIDTRYVTSASGDER